MRYMTVSYLCHDALSNTVNNNFIHCHCTQAYRMLHVTENHMELLKQFPSHFRFVVLQHSPDRYVLDTNTVGAH